MDGFFFFRGASEAEEIAFEESPWFEFIKPWMDKNRYPDTSIANTIAQRASSVVNANEHSRSNSLSSSIQALLTEFEIDLWIKAPPARASQSAKSRPNTRDTALTSIDGEKKKAEDKSFDSTATWASASARFSNSSLESVQQPLVPQMDGSTDVPDSSAANQSELQTSRSSTRDPFFDFVPKGPSQLSISRWDARFPSSNPLDSTCDQAPASPWSKTETTSDPGKHP